MSGPLLPFCQQLHETKYRSEGETFDEFVSRFCDALTDEHVFMHYAAMENIISDMRFLPAGRVQAWAGSPKIVTPYNCFVSPTINDSFVDPPRPEKGEDYNAVSIMEAARLAAQTMRQGGGIGYDLSTLRPSGDLIKGVRAKTDGPIAFMPVFDAVCKATSSAGERRGAQMGVLRIDHPDIRKYITMKHNNDFLTGFNVSVAVTDEFMDCLQSGRGFDLRFNGRVYDTVDPAELWDMIMRATWDWAEPGVLFIDTINRMNNLWYCEQIAATNPCGEQPLPPYGACLLGSFNLTKYVKANFYGIFQFDMDQFVNDIPHVVRTMDNVISAANYPLSQQKDEAVNKRRMGLGITGLANTAEVMGMPYGSSDFLHFEAVILETLRNETYRASIKLAREKGSFPMFDKEKYLKGKFIKTLPEDIQDGIKLFGIRNSHLTSIAPTGTISLCADNISSSIEPVFSHSQSRPVNMPSGPVMTTLKDYAFDKWGVKGKTTANVTVKEHLDVLVVASHRVDSAVSKTCNLDGSVPFEEFKAIYTTAYEKGVKGCTTFNKDGKRFALITDMDQKPHMEDVENIEDDGKPAEACYFNPETGQRHCE